MTSFLPADLLGFWSEWVRPSAGLPTVLWSLLLAVAAASGHLVQRYMGMPKVVGYSMVGVKVTLVGGEAQHPLSLARATSGLQPCFPQTPLWSSY